MSVMNIYSGSGLINPAKQALRNAGTGFFLYGFVSYGTSLAVNKVAHKLFRCEEGGRVSQAIKFASLVAGTAAGLYIGSFVGIYVFTATEALCLSAQALAIGAIATLILKDAFVWVLPFVLGCILGVTGRGGMAVMALAFAYGAAYAKNDAANVGTSS